MNPNRIPLLIAILVLLLSFKEVHSANLYSPDPPAQTKSIVIGFYNVENLFDTIDDPAIDDAEFTPNGKNVWTRELYEKKSNNIARVIAAMNNGNGPDILGLCEVENKEVIEHLIANKLLIKFSYAIAHHDSPDKRGIDVALIYKKNSMKVLNVKPLRVDISAFGDQPTRDVLSVTGVINKDTVYFFLNHWPSRRNGRETSEPKRIAAAAVVRKAVDSILLIHPQAKIIIMGDLNDNPTDKSITQELRAYKSWSAAKQSEEPNPLINPTNIFDWKKGEGSEFYRGDWSRFIQIIVSASLIRNQITEEGIFKDIYIFKQDWMMKSDAAYQQMVPERTFETDHSIGFSDHLPVLVILKL